MPDIFIARPEKEKPVKPIKKELDEALAQGSRFLASFVSRPRNLHFETQEKKEKIVLLLRRHPITNLPWVLLGILMVIAPLTISRIVSLAFIPANYLFISLLVWYLLVFAYVFERFLTWFFNVNILTDERIVDIDFPSLLYREISSAKTDQIQDVSVKVGGFVRSLFNYGDVLIQTAGTIPEICFEAVPNPEQVSRILNELIYEEEQEKLDGRVR